MTHARFSEALHDLVFNQAISVDEAMDKHFAADYQHRNSGTPRTRAEFAALAEGGRAEITAFTITVLDEFRDGDRYAERHLIDVTKRDGSTEQAEIYVIGRYAADGRFAVINEAGFPLS
jgi:hypothetical protein